MQFSFPKIAWSADVFDKLLKSIKDSIEKHDYDSGWIKTPSDKKIKHNLNALPVEIFVQSADNLSGSDFVPDTFTFANKTSVTINGAKAYCRVIINI